MQESEQQLVTSATEGDGDALEELLSRCDGTLRARMQSKIAAQYQGAFDVDDVLQVTYLEAFLRIRQFDHRGSGSFPAWLGKIAENNLRDAIRGLERDKRPPRAKQVQPHIEADPYTTILANLGATVTSPGRGAARGELKDIIESTLQQLPADYEQAVRLYDMEGKPIAEVAQVLERSNAAVHMLRARAHDRLKELLGESTNFFSHPA